MHDVMREQRARVALVCMPWGALETPSLALALLKQYVIDAGLEPELHYLNVRFAETLGPELYERVAHIGTIQTEWFFSHALFGPGGTGEVKNGWDDLARDPGAEKLLQHLRDSIGMPEIECRRIATDVVPAYIDECLNGIDWSRYLIVGFTTTFAQSLATLLLAQRIKQRHPHVKIVIGGANVDAEMGVEMMKACEWIDYVVHGEAEVSFPRLLTNLVAGHATEQVPGVSIRHADHIARGDDGAQPAVDLNAAPTPDYSDYVNALTRARLQKQVRYSLFFESSRGCWWGAKHHCTFCGLNGTTMAFRKKSPDKVYGEILALSKRYRCLRLAATDNILANEYFAELLPRLAELKVDLELFYEVKANLRREQLSQMAAAGIVTIQPGIESFSSRLLQLMRKGVTAIQNMQLLKWCHETGIEASYNLLFGFPQETPEDYADLPEICLRLSHLRPPASMSPIVFERFSPYHFEADRFKLRLQPWAEYRYIYPERVDFARIAYFFRGEWEGQLGDPHEYIKPACDVWKAWRAAWLEQKIYCYYEKGPDYLRIADNRPRRAGDPPRLKGYYLNEEMAAIYLFCDEHRSFKSILAMAQQQFGARMTEAIVRRWLDRFTAEWLMFREGDRYLSLAVRTASLYEERHRNRKRAAAAAAC